MTFREIIYNKNKQIAYIYHYPIKNLLRVGLLTNSAIPYFVKDIIFIEVENYLEKRSASFDPTQLDLLMEIEIFPQESNEVWYLLKTLKYEELTFRTSERPLIKDNFLEDLTETLIHARMKDEEWSETLFWKTIALLSSKLPGVDLHFDYSSGEKWGSLVIKNKLIALLRWDAPLFILLGEWSKNVKQLINDLGIILILVPDMDEIHYSIDPEKISEIFPMHVWAPEISPFGFSIGDLWYTTVT